MIKAYIQQVHPNAGKMVLQALIPFRNLRESVLFTCKANPNSHYGDDDDLGHGLTVESLCHGICCNQTGRCIGINDGLRIHDIADCKDDKRIERNRKHNREKKHLSNLFQRNIDLLCRLRNDIKSDEEERTDCRYSYNIAEDTAGRCPMEDLAVQIGGLARKGARLIPSHGTILCHHKADITEVTKTP